MNQLRRHMDLFNDILPLIDRGEYKKILKLSEKELKEISPYIVMKFMSGTKDKKTEAYHIMAINEIVNKYFWDYSDYKDLQIMLLTLCGTGKKQFHYFPGKNLMENSLFKTIKQWHPTWKADELEMYIDISEKNDLLDEAKDRGIQDKELSKFKKELEKWKK